MGPSVRGGPRDCSETDGAKRKKRKTGKKGKKGKKSKEVTEEGDSGGLRLVLVDGISQREGSHT